MKRLMRRNAVKWFMLGTAMVVVRLFFFHTNEKTFKTLTFQDLLNFTFQDENILSKPFLVVPNLKRDKPFPRNTVVMVLSKASNMLQRNTIRKTWGNQEMRMKYNFSVYFVVGREEWGVMDDRTDILQVDVMEHYNNLTDKTYAAFNWVSKFCREASYFFKVDDDVFLDLDFLKEIQTNSSYLPDDTILGSCHLASFPERTPSKWQVPYGEYPFSTYPPFCNGPGYIMTLNTARKLYMEMTKTRTFKLEDVYVGMVAYRLGMSVKNVENFVYNFNIYAYHWLLKDVYCHCHTIIHYASPETVKHLWDKQTIIGKNQIDCSIWGIGRYLLT